MIAFDSLDDMLSWSAEYKIPTELVKVNRAEYDNTNDLIQNVIDLAYFQSPVTLEHELSVLHQEYRIENTWYKSVLLQDKINGSFLVCMIFQLL